MKYLRFTFLITCVAMLTFSCSPDQFDPEASTDSVASQIELRSGNGAIQISGVGYIATPSECEVAEGAFYAMILTGDLVGCLNVFIDDWDCLPGGTFHAVGREYFVGSYGDEPGTFWTNFRFEGKYEGCNDDGFFEGAEIFGRCQHPIVKDSGTGVFEGVSGRINFEDDVETGALPYKGHLKF